MENNANQQSDATRSAESVDLRTKLRITLNEEFQKALSLAAAITEDQRKALNKLVADDNVTSQAILKALNPVIHAKEDTKNE
jgi:hypothetical protein